MGKFLMSVLCLAVGSYCYVVSHPACDEMFLVHKVSRGDTLYSIASQHYAKNENGMCFDEFRYNVSEDNKNLQNPKRFLQVGDKVIVRYYKKK